MAISTHTLPFVKLYILAALLRDLHCCKEGDRHRRQSDTSMEFESVRLDLKTQMSGLATAVSAVQEGKQSQAHLFVTRGF